MPVAMRLMRMGTIHNPVYRISIGDSRKVPTAKFIEHIGTYNPKPDKMGHKQLRLNVARAKYWIAMGCQPSAMVARLLSRFHLLPVPPSRINIPTGTLLHRVLAGEDVRPVLQQLERQASAIESVKPKSAEVLAAEAAEAKAEAARLQKQAAEEAAEEALAAEEIDEKDFDGDEDELEDKKAAIATAKANVARRSRERKAEAAEQRKAEALRLQEEDEEEKAQEGDEAFYERQANGALAPSVSLRLTHRWFREPTPARIAQLQASGAARWKLQKFPFSVDPTGPTNAAWEQARAHHRNLVQHPTPAGAVSYRRLLRLAERRRARRRERFEDAQAGRERTKAMQVRDVLEDLEEVDYRRLMQLEPPPPLGQEDSIDVQANSVAAAAGAAAEGSVYEQLAAREAAVRAALSAYEKEAEARAAALGIDLTERLAERASEEAELREADAEAAQIQAQRTGASSADAEEVRGSDGEGEEDAELQAMVPPVPVVLSQAAQKTLRLMLQAQSLASVDAGVAYRAHVSYEQLNVADRAEIDEIIRTRAIARARRYGEERDRQVRLAEMEKSLRHDALLRRARAFIAEHAGSVPDLLSVQRDSVHFDSLKPEERAAVVAASLRKREEADIAAYIGAQKEALARNEARIAAAEEYGGVGGPEAVLEPVDEQALEEWEETRMPTAEEIAEYEDERADQSDARRRRRVRAAQRRAEREAEELEGEADDEIGLFDPERSVLDDLDADAEEEQEEVEEQGGDRRGGRRGDAAPPKKKGVQFDVTSPPINADAATHTAWKQFVARHEAKVRGTGKRAAIDEEEEEDFDEDVVEDEEDDDLPTPPTRAAEAAKGSKQAGNVLGNVSARLRK